MRCSTQTLKVLGDYTLEDKADIVLMTPVECLLDMIPSRLSMPYTGLSTMRFPEKGAMSSETEGLRSPHQHCLPCDR